MEVTIFNMNKNISLIFFHFFMILFFVSGISFAQTHKNKVSLSDLDLEKVVQSYWTPLKDKAVTSESIKVNGVAYAKGIGVLPESKVFVFLNGESQYFNTKVGIQDRGKLPGNLKSNALSDGSKLFYTEEDRGNVFFGIGETPETIGKGSVRFSVKGDGKILWSSDVISGGDSAVDVAVDVSHVKVLELVVTDGGDGISGDHGVWIAPAITYSGFEPVLVDESYLSQINDLDRNYETVLKPLVSRLPIGTPELVNGVKKDWLVNEINLESKIFKTDDARSIVISNGLVSRTFRVTPNCTTTAFNNLMTGERLLRGVGPEAVVEIDGMEYNVGGLDGQKEYGYLKDEWLHQMWSTLNSFQLERFEISSITNRINWPNKRWSLAAKKAIKGKSIVFVYKHQDFPELTVNVHYNIYDGIPLLSKWISVDNKGEQVVLNSFKTESLAFVEAESAVERSGGSEHWELPNIHIESDYAFHAMSFKSSNKVVHWLPDSRYTSQVNYPRQTPCLLECKLPAGPDETIEKGGVFESFRVWELPFDSDDKQRKGLFTNEMYKLIAPWVTENPMFLHLTTTDDEKVKAAIDQCVETGYEMVILSFGSGLNMEDTSPENIEKYKALADYAHERGIELGGYSLLSSRWISDEVDVINPETGKRGGVIHGSSPCLNSQWGIAYFDKLKTFFEKTGFDLLEHDGSYPGQYCASTRHVGHKGLEDSQWKAWKRITDFYKWCNEKGISLNIPDWYYLSGSNKNSIGYREVNWSLPRERQIILGRQNIYDGTFDRLPGMSWTFVPLTQYHGGGAEATIEPLNENLSTYEAHMMQNYGMGIQACYRGPRLYDTEKTKHKVTEVVHWYKKYREILNSPIIHLKRADGNSLDGMLHVNPRLKHKALAMFFNPTDQEVVTTVSLPLYYTGLTDRAVVRIGEGKKKSYKLTRDYQVAIELAVPPKANVWLVVE